MNKICKKITSGTISIFLLLNSLPGMAQSTLKSFHEDFQSFTENQDLCNAFPCSGQITSASNQSFTAAVDSSSSVNIAARMYDGNGSTGKNVLTRISMEDMNGSNTHGIVTVQYRVMLDAISKYSTFSLTDGAEVISRIMVHPGTNCGLVLQSPSIADGAGAGTKETILSWGSQNSDGTYLAKGSWQTIKYQLNFNSKTFALFYNGAEKASGAFNSANADSIDSLSISTGDGEIACLYLDDIYAADGKDLTVAGHPAETDESGYKWNNVPIGGGGFVTGMVIHPTEPDLVYCRTDVGGAYRWDKDNNTWIPLTDSFTLEDTSFYGVDGIAIDPKNPDILYIAAGKSYYTKGDILKSYDRGKTWTRTYFHGAIFDGNGTYRGSGECISVDASDSNIVYCGTYNNGLWKSTNGGYSWEKVIDTTAQVRTVTSYSSPDSTSSTVYAGTISDGLYKSVDSGSTWNKVEGAPSVINRMEISKSGIVYLASSSGVFKYENDTFTEISPVIGGSYNAITIDPTDEQTLMALGPHTSENFMAIPFFRSTDGGSTWSNKLSECHVTSTRPWDKTDSVGGNISSNSHCLLIDPINPKRVWLSDWFGVFKTDDITSSGTQDWTFLYDGLEEMVPRDFICPETGPYRFIAGVADNDGLVYTDYKSYPNRRIRTGNRIDPPTYKWMMSTCSIDYCRSNPDYVVRVGIDWDCMPKAEISTDGMNSWKNIIFSKKSDPTQSYSLKYNGLGQVAVSSDVNPETGYPSIVVISSGSLPLVSDDLGKTWEEVSGITDTSIFIDHWKLGTHIAADSENSSVFYIQDSKFGTSTIYKSCDYGHTWTAISTVSGQYYDVNRNFIKTAPGMEGEVWSCITGSYLYRSSDGAESFTKLENIYNVQCFGFGKNAPGKSNPTVYVYGTVNNVYGVYRSTDMGESWKRINSPDNPMGCGPIVLEGDMRTFGVVYIGTSGRGIYYGEPEELDLETPSPTAAPTASPEITPVPSPEPTPTASPEASPTPSPVAMGFSESFEEYETGTKLNTLPAWCGSDYAVISNNSEGTNTSDYLSIELPSQKGESVRRDFESASGIVDVSMKHAFDSTNVTSQHIFLYSGDKIISGLWFYLNSGGWTNDVAFYHTDKDFDCNTTSGFKQTFVRSLAKNTWYNIKMRLDFGKQTVTAVISDSDITEEIMDNPEQAKNNGQIIAYATDNFVNNADYIDGLSMGAMWSYHAHNMYFDDISVVPYIATPKYTVSFLDYDSSVISSQEVWENKTATEPPKPSRPGYTFNGWYLDGKLYDFSVPVTGNISLVARYSEQTIVMNEPFNYDADTTAGSLEGWTTGGSGFAKVVGNEDKTNSVLYLNADRQKEISAKRTFDSTTGIVDVSMKHSFSLTSNNGATAQHIYLYNGNNIITGLWFYYGNWTSNIAFYHEDQTFNCNTTSGFKQTLAGSIQTDTWYNITMRLDFEKQTVTAVVSTDEIDENIMDDLEGAKNNGLIVGYATDSFVNAAEYIDGLSMGAMWSYHTHDMYFDDITVVKAPTPKCVYSLENGSYTKDGNTYTVSASITKGETDASVIIAAYDNENNLSYVLTDNEAVGANVAKGTQLDYSKPFETDKNVSSIKILVWDMPTAYPLCEGILLR